MRILLSWSGGKDSALALSTLRREGEHDVAGLLTTIDAEEQRVGMHGVPIDLLREQARLLGMPLDVIEIPHQFPDNATYETATLAALTRARANGIEGIAFGDIYLEDLREYRERLLARAGLTGIYPLWQRDSRELLREFIEDGWRAIVVCTDANHLEPSWSGRELDARFAAELPASVDACGERGEYHSFVYDGPLFACPVAFTRGELIDRPPFTYCDLRRVTLAP